MERLNPGGDVHTMPVRRSTAVLVAERADGSPAPAAVATATEYRMAGADRCQLGARQFL